MLIGVGLLVGLRVGSGIGVAENAPSAKGSVIIASAKTRVSNHFRSSRAKDALHMVDLTSGIDADEDLLETGEIIAQYRSISIDSLPIHRPMEERNALDSLTIVTLGAIGSGESLGSSMRRQGISPGTVHLIATEMRKVFDFRRSRPGDHYRLGQDSEGRVLDFRYAQGPEESFYLSWEGTRYVVRTETAELRPQIAKIAGIVDSSFYGAILALGEQSSLASEFARIFAWDIDFSRNVHPGDEFQILYERLYRRNDEGEEVYVRPGRILAGRYEGNVGLHTIVFFEDEDEVGGYFRPDGSSVERAFLVAPLEFSRISSRFTRARRHPILKVTRPHPGIDYAAPLGTPIWAVADGVVEYRARAGASGNLIRIRHVGGYTSHYAHLSRFAKNFSVGDRVEQKQIIGYVGSTGLSTGPHVCFRVKKNGNYVDPMRIKSPAGLSVDSQDLIVFRNERDRLLADLGPGPLNLADEAL
jgi:murein DD-endopeptidase MepM/ murein hydrolase activator NlpD